MKLTAFALLLAVPALAGPAPKPTPADAHAELKAALEAHMDGDDVKARRHLAACVKKGAGTVDAAGCEIYLEWWAKGVKQVDKPSQPISRRLYSLGAEAYKKGDLRTARDAWIECLDESEVGTAVRNDCLAMIDLVPGPPLPAAEANIRETYALGLLLYGQGDLTKARAKWMLCLESAPKGGLTWTDCRAAIAKLDADEKKR